MKRYLLNLQKGAGGILQWNLNVCCLNTTSLKLDESIVHSSKSAFENENFGFHLAHLSQNYNLPRGMTTVIEQPV